MRWSALEEHEREHLQSLKERTGSAKVLDDFIDPLPGWAWVLDAFHELGTDRQIAMGAGPIPAASIDRYVDRHGFSRDEEEEFRFLIRKLDGAFLDHARRETKKKSPPKSPPLRGNRRG